MDPLYYLEHKFLPVVIYQGKEKYGLDVFDLANSFAKICNATLQNYQEAAKEKCPVTVREEHFQVDAVPFGDRADARAGKLGGFILRLFFPFTANAQPLCRRAYIVTGPQGENPLYYTVEYNQREQTFYLCAWDKNLCHVEFGKVDDNPDKELKRILEVDQHRPEMQEAIAKAIQETIYNNRK